MSFLIDRTALKTTIKSILYRLIPKTNGYSLLKVRSGPAKGARLQLDVRIEGSYWLGTYDKWIFDAVDFSDYIDVGDVVWDCGAYVGYYSASFRKLVESTGSVHAFEGSANNYERLRALPANNRWSNVHIHHLAIGPDHCMLEFVDNLGGSSGPYGMSKHYDGDEADLSIVRVKCCGVDELVYEHGIPAPDFIKFDLESAEEFALQNGERVFAEKRPAMLLELHTPEAKRAAGTFLEKYGYEGIIVHDPSIVVHSLADLERIEGIPHMVLCVPL